MYVVEVAHGILLVIKIEYIARVRGVRFGVEVETNNFSVAVRATIAPYGTRAAKELEHPFRLHYFARR